MLEKALKFAIKAHEGQTRKNKSFPMIVHPLAVGDTLLKAGFSLETVVAGYLHDVAEDTHYTMEDITREFGNEVARIVAGDTENKDLSWEERKQHTIDVILEAPLEIKALIVADKLDNLRTLVADYERIGDSVWNQFKRGKDKQKWYFETISIHSFKNVAEADIPLFFYDYQRLVESFFKGDK